MCGATRDVRFVPIADIRLLDHLVGSPDQSVRDDDAECLGRSEVYDELAMPKA